MENNEEIKALKHILFEEIIAPNCVSCSDSLSNSINMINTLCELLDEEKEKLKEIIKED